MTTLIRAFFFIGGKSSILWFQDKRDCVGTFFSTNNYKCTVVGTVPAALLKQTKAAT